MSDSLVFRFTSASRLRLIGTIFLVAWFTIFVVYHATARHLLDQEGNAIGRDFLAFYAAGKIVRDGCGSSLYDATTQRTAQAAVIAPEPQQGYYYYINPASVAAAYSLFSRLPYLQAFYLHTAMMFTFFWIGMWVLKPHLPALESSWLAAALLGVTWAPMMHAITAGQNTSLTFMILSLVYAATVANRQWLAGLALGLQFFKPQYALPILGLLLLRRQVVTACVAALIAGGHYLLGATVAGWNWPMEMARAASGHFKEVGRLVQGPTHVSFLEVIDYSIVLPLESAGIQQGLLTAVEASAWLAVASVAVYLIVAWRKAEPSQPDFGVFYALAVAGTVLISPHAHYYDIALLILSLMLVLEHRHRTQQMIGAGLRTFLIVVYVGYPFILLLRISQQIHFQPLFLLLAWFVYWCARHTQRLRESK